MDTIGNDTTGFSLGGLLNTATQLATTGASVYNSVTGKSAPAQKTAVQTATSSYNTLYIIGGVVVAVLVGALVFMRKGR